MGKVLAQALVRKQSDTLHEKLPECHLNLSNCRKIELQSDKIKVIHYVN